MKSNKVGFIITLVIALLFAIGGVIVLLLPKPYSPVTVSETVQASKSGAYISIFGKLKNETEEQVTVTFLEVDIDTNGPKILASTNEHIEIAAGDEYDLNGFAVESDGYSPTRVTEVKVRVDGVTYTIYESTSTKTLGCIILFAMAGVFGICAIVMLVGYSRGKKRYAEISKTLSSMEGNGVFLSGAYGVKGGAGKAAAKTAASVTVGALSALFFGFGVYKVYGANTPKEFVVTDNGLYVGAPAKNGLNFSGMTYFAKGTFPDSVVTVKKRQVIMLNNNTGESFVFDTQKDGITAQQLAERLQTLISAPAHEEQPAQQDAQNAPSPFEEFSEKPSENENKEDK